MAKSKEPKDPAAFAPNGGRQKCWKSFKGEDAKDHLCLRDPNHDGGCENSKDKQHAQEVHA